MKTLTQRRRPNRFSEILGQKLAVSVMKRAALNPAQAARVYLFHGFSGTGKTTLARVFATALNCTAEGSEPCGLCEICKSSLDYAPHYSEYDCSTVGNKEDIEVIKETLILDSSLADYRVVVFDEFHLASKQAQSALLKILEELSSNTFVVFCTTEHEMIVKGIRSRATELYFPKLTEDKIVTLLTSVALKENFKIEGTDLQKIARATGGHAREAVKILGLAMSVGLELALASFQQAKDAVVQMLTSVKTKDRESFEEAIEMAVLSLRSQYTKALYREVYSMLKPEDSDLKKLWGADAFKLFKLLMQPWASIALKGDINTQSLLWTVWFSVEGTKRKVNRPLNLKTQVSDEEKKFRVNRCR